MTTRWLDADTAVVTATGEIDALNTEECGAHAARVAGQVQQLVLDLRNVGFFGLQGFSVFDPALAEVGARWVVVPGPAVARVLRLCDPDGVLPTAGSVELAVARLRGAPRTTLQLLCR